METEPEKPQEEAPAPSRRVRFNWWWGIYLFGTIGPPFLWMVGRIDPLGLVSTLLLTAMMCPFGFAYDFSVLCENLFYRLGFGSAEDLAGLITVISIPLGYVIFIVHYRLTSEAKTRRVFLLLMLSLGLLTCGSLVGYEHSLAQAMHH